MRFKGCLEAAQTQGAEKGVREEGLVWGKLLGVLEFRV